MNKRNILIEIPKDEKLRWSKWLAWHRDWKHRRTQAYKGIKDRRTIEKIQKEYMNEFWKAREEILGH